MVIQSKDIYQKNITILVIFAVVQDITKHFHVAVYQFQDLATLFGVNIFQQANANNHTTEVVEELVIE